jgi:hypothetical protein
MFERFTTVVDAASSYDLTTVGTVKAELNIGSTTTSDAVLRRYISAASRDFARSCNRVFVVETIEDRFSRRSSPFDKPTDTLQLARIPVVEVASVDVDGEVLTEQTDFLVDPESGQIVRVNADGVRLNWSGALVKVIYDAGFETIPSDIEDFVIRKVSARYFAKGRDLSIRQEAVEGIGERQFFGSASGTTADGSDLVDRYRQPVVA